MSLYFVINGSVFCFICSFLIVPAVCIISVLIKQNFFFYRINVCKIQFDFLHYLLFRGL